jgi:hypothetical protein
MRAELLLEFVYSALLATTASPLIPRIAGQRTLAAHVGGGHTVHTTRQAARRSGLLSRGQTFGGTDDNWAKTSGPVKVQFYV